MRNILDLKKKEIKIVEKIIVKKRIWWIESLKMLGVLSITIGVTWAVSQADILMENLNEEEKDTEEASTEVVQRLNFNARGTVSSISESSLSLTEASSFVSKDTSFTFSMSDVQCSEHRTRELIPCSDIIVDEKVLVLGTRMGQGIIVKQVHLLTEIPVVIPVPEEIPEVVPEETPVVEVAPVLEVEETLQPEVEPGETLPPDDETPEISPEPTPELPPTEDVILEPSPSPELPPAEEPSLTPEEENIPSDESVQIPPEQEVAPTPEVPGESTEEPQSEEMVGTPPEVTLPEDEPAIEDTPEVTIPEDEPVVDETPEEVPPAE